MSVWHGQKHGRHRIRATVERAAGEPGARQVDPVAKQRRRKANKAARKSRKAVN